jgi:hypothetical protein
MTISKHSLTQMPRTVTERVVFEKEVGTGAASYAADIQYLAADTPKDALNTFFGIGGELANFVVGEVEDVNRRSVLYCAIGSA